MSVSDAAVFGSISVMRKHNLNATDAALLALLLRHTAGEGAPAFVVIASDKRLLRAATAEGFLVCNPEETSPDEALTLISVP
jgi:hypothetical protein